MTYFSAFIIHQLLQLSNTSKLSEDLLGQEMLQCLSKNKLFTGRREGAILGYWMPWVRFDELGIVSSPPSAAWQSYAHPAFAAKAPGGAARCRSVESPRPGHLSRQKW